MVQSDDRSFALQSTTISRIEQDKASRWRAVWPAVRRMVDREMYGIEDVWMDTYPALSG